MIEYSKFCIRWIFLFGFVLHGDSAGSYKTSTLHCYQCITLSCFPEHSVQPDPSDSNYQKNCMTIKSYVTHEIGQNYYAQEPGKELPNCPKPFSAGEEWEAFYGSPPCQGQQGQATCALGRFKVTSWNAETNENSTVYGTVLGCANQILLGKISEIMKTRSSGGGGCLLEKFQGFISTSVYYLELEHCPQPSDLCYNRDFCISPKNSLIRSFINREETGGGTNFFIIALCVIIAIGILIAVLTFLGIKYNS